MKTKLITRSDISAVMAYCAAHNLPCWAVHTESTSQIGGVSVQLTHIRGNTATIQYANGDLRDVSLSEIHLRAN